MKNIQLIFTFFTLWLSIFFNDSSENMAAFFFILSLGILHGANDIGVGVKTFGAHPVFSNKWALLFLYLVSIGGVALLLFAIPSFTLLFFVLISGYHFGEQHWSVMVYERTAIRTAFFVSYGLLVFSILFHAHISSVTAIIGDITDVYLPPSFFSYLLWISFAITVLLYLLFFRNLFSVGFAWKQLFYILLFSVVFYSTSLLWAFAIYFIFWHSLPSLIDQMNFLYGNTSVQSLFKYIKESLLYWLVAVGSLGCYYFFLREFALLDISMFFAFLTALTIPHIVMMFFLKKSV